MKYVMGRKIGKMKMTEKEKKITKIIEMANNIVVEEDIKLLKELSGY